MIDQSLIEKAARIPGIADLARVIHSGAGAAGTRTTDADISALRLGGGVLGGVAGGVGGGLAGLLHRYTTADEDKRKLRDYLKSILIGGGIGAGVGAGGLSAAGGALGQEMQALESQGGAR